jgi:hypothetical protein
MPKPGGIFDIDQSSQCVEIALRGDKLYHLNC